MSQERPHSTAMTATEILAREEWYWRDGPGAQRSREFTEAQESWLKAVQEIIWKKLCEEDAWPKMVADFFMGHMPEARQWFKLSWNSCQCKRCYNWRVRGEATDGEILR